jgi:predicted transcriptional regulator
MNRIEIDVINPKAEQAALLAWAASVDAGAVPAQATARLHFASYRQLHATLTEKRMGLLERVAQNEGKNIRQLAADLGRDYRNVYDDVQRLAQLGLIEIREGKLYVPYDEIDIRKTLREAA